MMNIASRLLIALFAFPSASVAQSRPADLPRQIFGRVQVLDSTTFQFLKAKQVIRLAGFEAPRLEQIAASNGVSWPAGQVARAWMILRTLGQDVNCAPIGRDRNGALLAHCFVGETNLAATAIAEGIGYAFNYPDESRVTAYFDIERKARGLGYGVWSSPGLPPPWLYASPLAKPANLEPGRWDPEPGLPLPLPVSKQTSDANNTHGD